MGTVRLFKFEKPAELAQAAASATSKLVAESRQHPFRMAVSGGRIARLFFESLGQEFTAQPELISSIDLFWADERAVPPGDAESNYRLAAEALLARCSFSPGQVHRIRGDLSPDLAAQQASTEMLEANGCGAGQIPVLDLVQLGMGEDGHVASLFPGEPLDVQESAAIYRSVIARKPPPHRVTLGYAPILAARNVMVLASGAGKEMALEVSLNSEETPLGRVIKHRAATWIFTDIFSREKTLNGLKTGSI